MCFDILNKLAVKIIAFLAVAVIISVVFHIAAESDLAVTAGFRMECRLFSFLHPQIETSWKGDELFSVAITSETQAKKLGCRLVPQMVYPEKIPEGYHFTQLKIWRSPGSYFKAILDFENKEGELYSIWQTGIGEGKLYINDYIKENGFIRENLYFAEIPNEEANMIIYVDKETYYTIAGSFDRKTLLQFAEEFIE